MGGPVVFLRVIRHHHHVEVTVSGNDDFFGAARHNLGAFEALAVNVRRGRNLGDLLPPIARARFVERLVPEYIRQGLRDDVGVDISVYVHQ